MRKRVLISVDIGTQGTKAAAVDLEGNIVAEAFQASNLITPRPGVVEEDPREMLSSVINTIKAVVERLGSAEVLAVGVAGQMAGILGIGADGEAVTHYDSWLDTRCEPYITMMKEKAGDLLVQTTGAPPSYTHGPKILWWKHERPEVYADCQVRGAQCLCGGAPGGLTGDEAYQDYTTYIFRFCRCPQYQVVCGAVDLFKVTPDKRQDRSALAGHGRPYTKHGTYAGCPAELRWWPAAVIPPQHPWVQALPAWTALRCSGNGVHFLLLCGPLLPPMSPTRPCFMPGRWCGPLDTHGLYQRGGMCLKWFRDNFTAEQDYRQLDLEAGNVSPARDLIFLPHFSGRVAPNDPYVRGTWIGLTWSHTRGHLYRSIMEGIGYEYKLYFNIIKELMGDYKFSDVRVIGGGAKSAVFNSIKASILGQRYAALAVKDAASIGAAVVAGYGVGVFDDFQKTLDSIITVQDQVEPNLEHFKAYAPHVERYEKALQSISGLLAG